MADSDKNIHIHPKRGHTDQPYIEFTGYDNNPVTLTVLDDGTLSFSGSAGELFSISDSLTGTIFSVNDVSGIPSLEVEDDGTVTIAEFAGDVVIGAANTSYTNSDNTPVIAGLSDTKVFVDGSIYLTGGNDGIMFGRGTGSFLKDEELAFGWGGGWYMTDGTYIRARNNKTIYSGGNIEAGSNITAQEFYTNGWFRNNQSGEGLYNQATGAHWVSEGDGYWTARDSAGHIGIQLKTNGSTLRGYVYADSSNQVGFLDAGGSWAIKHVNDSGTYFYTDGSTEEFKVGRDVVTGNYGTVQTSSTRSSWGGYSIAGRVVFMHDHSNGWGIYNDVNNEWMIYGTLNGQVELRYNSSTKLTTTNTGVDVTGTLTVNGAALPGAPTMYVFYEDANGNLHYDVPSSNTNYDDSTDGIEYIYMPGSGGMTYAINSSGEFTATY
jgi:hypothetical protein